MKNWGELLNALIVSTL